jgi:hypothetical protein
MPQHRNPILVRDAWPMHQSKAMSGPNRRRADRTNSGRASHCAVILLKSQIGTIPAMTFACRSTTNPNMRSGGETVMGTKKFEQHCRA